MQWGEDSRSEGDKSDSMWSGTWDSKSSPGGIRQQSNCKSAAPVNSHAWKNWLRAICSTQDTSPTAMRSTTVSSHPFPPPACLWFYTEIEDPLQNRFSFFLICTQLEQWGPNPSRRFVSSKDLQRVSSNHATKQPFQWGRKQYHSRPALQPSHHKAVRRAPSLLPTRSPLSFSPLPK